VVERSPEKAGVGGSTPSLATIIPENIIRDAIGGSRSAFLDEEDEQTRNYERGFPDQIEVEPSLTQKCEAENLMSLKTGRTGSVLGLTSMTSRSR
jgi:hypothetical protein